MKKSRNNTSLIYLKDETTTKVRFSEVDSMKVVWHGVYSKYLEDGRESFGRHYSGIGYMDMYNNGYTAPIVEMNIQYLSPLTIDDQIVIETLYEYTEAAKICMSYVIRNASNGKIAAKGRTVQVFVDGNGDLSLNNPDFYEEWKKKWIK